jgi:hypothetical protein
MRPQHGEIGDPAIDLLFSLYRGIPPRDWLNPVERFQDGDTVFSSATDIVNFARPESRISLRQFEENGELKSAHSSPSFKPQIFERVEIGVPR